MNKKTQQKIVELFDDYKSQLSDVKDLYHRYLPAPPHLKPLWKEMEQGEIKRLKIKYFDMMLEAVQNE